jgi:protein phosphatase
MRDPRGQARFLMIVADGMGGAEAGEVASHMAVEAVASVFFDSSEGPARALQAAVAEANRRIHQAAQVEETRRGMGTTCTAVTVADGHACAAHVGDSRAYWLRGTTLRRLTSVHSVWAERVAREWASPALAEGRNVLTRVLGVEEQVEPEIVDRVALAAGDRLILCSDGLWGLVLDVEIASVAGGRPPADACRDLVALANERGGPDNISVVVAEVQPEGAVTP